MKKPIPTTIAVLLFAAPVLPLFAAGAALEATSARTEANENYLLTVNDLVDVKVFQEDDLTTSARISADGTIVLPLIGQVKIGGLTALDASRKVAELLNARFLVNPQVALTVASFAQRRFTVLGQVTKAGAYNMQFHDSVDLLEAIGLAGGYTRLANQAKIMVKRRDGARDVIFEINGKDLASGRVSKGFRVLAGDTITVTERRF